MSPLYSLVFSCLFCCGVLLIACTPNGIYHTVQPGQTLYRIAKTYNIEERELARINRISNPRRLKAGQRLYIPGVTQPRHVRATAKTATASKPKTVNRPQSSATKAAAAPPTKQTQIAQSQKTVNKRTKSSPGKPVKGLFSWPLKGKVLSTFGSGKGAGKGIEIDAAAGSAVTASAPGKVIYSGNAIRGYGNLIILEHSDNYFTVYGYNKKNLVAMDDFVGKGDKIALSGAPPDGKSPRLHFEIRHGKAAVNPIFYLP